MLETWKLESYWHTQYIENIAIKECEPYYKVTIVETIRALDTECKFSLHMLSHMDVQLYILCLFYGRAVYVNDISWR